MGRSVRLFEIVKTNRFKKEFLQMIKRGNDPKLFEDVVRLLLSKAPIPAKYRNHPLKGKYTGFMDIHIAPDWILIYKIQGNILLLDSTGTHSDLF